MKKLLFLLPLIFAFTSCKKCEPKGEVILSEEFNDYGNWILWSDISDDFEVYSRIEDGVLKMRTNQKAAHCNRATYTFEDGELNNYSEFSVCIEFVKLELPKDVYFHMYFAFGGLETHVNIKKPFKNSKTLCLYIKEGKVTSNLKGALNGNLGVEILPNDNTDDFIQFAICPDEDEEEGELYVEIGKIELGVQN